MTTPTEVPPAPAKRSRVPFVIGLVAAFVVLATGIGVGAAWAFSPGGVFAPKGKPPVQAASAWDLEQQANKNGASQPDPFGPTDPPPSISGPPLTKADLKLTLKVTDKQCFGDAGCNIEAKVQAELVTGFESAETWEITYQITGVESGPVIGSFELTGGQYNVNEEMLQTAQQSDKPKVAVTSVEKVGI